MAMRELQRNPGCVLHVNLEDSQSFDIGRGFTNAVLHMEPSITLDSMYQYNEERAQGKIPSMIKGSETHTGTSKKNKAKKPGKRKARISPLMKNLLKGVT